VSATPSWYDVLDVDQSATTEEIRTAWKAAIAGLDPTDRRFRVLNQAAEVLLDPVTRAEYDAGLTSHAAPVSLEKQTPEPERVSRPTGTRRGVPGWLLVGLLLATLLFVVLSVVEARDNDDGGTSTTSSSEAIPDAQAAAEKAAVAITAYDFRDLEGSRAAAIPFMSKAYQEKYDRLFAVVEENAPNTKTVVQTRLVASAVGLVGDDRIQVLVFFDRSTTNAVVSEPQITRDQATLTMVREGGEWLVDDLTTTLPTS
jgi:Mce-associated membrane protein